MASVLSAKTVVFEACRLAFDRDNEKRFNRLFPFQEKVKGYLSYDSRCPDVENDGKDLKLGQTVTKNLKLCPRIIAMGGPHEENIVRACAI